MATPRKVTTVRYYDTAGRECDKRAPGATRRATVSNDYWGVVPRPGQRRGKRVRLCGDFGESKRMLTRLRADAQKERLGIDDPFAEHARRPIEDHVADYERHLLDQEGTPAHARKTASRITAVVGGIAARALADLDAGRAVSYLAGRREAGRVAELAEGVESYRPSDAARVLGVSVAAVGKAVKLHGLEASGNGKARRLPRATVQALLDRAARGISAETRNHYVRALRAFGAWLSAAKRVEADPFRGIKLVKTTTDRRHDRRDATRDEVARLCDAALAGQRVFRGMDGAARRAVYLTAVLTGIRAGALAGLTPASFHLGDDPPYIDLPARLAKSRKPETKFVARDTAAALLAFLAGRPNGEPIWPGTWSLNSAAMIRIDLAEAGIPYEVAGPNGPLFFDFHALRHSHASLSRRSGNDQETTRRSMGHSTQAMTARYTHVDDGERAEAAERLGDFLSGGSADAKKGPSGG